MNHLTVKFEGIGTKKDFIWSQLLLSGIETQCGIDNGFVTVEVDKEASSEAREFINNMSLNGKKFKVIKSSKSISEAKQFRQNYWI